VILGMLVAAEVAENYLFHDAIVKIVELFRELSLNCLEKNENKIKRAIIQFSNQLNLQTVHFTLTQAPPTLYLNHKNQLNVPQA
jgi:hypothetical protein